MHDAIMRMDKFASRIKKFATLRPVTTKTFQTYMKERNLNDILLSMDLV